MAESTIAASIGQQHHLPRGVWYFACSQ